MLRLGEFARCATGKHLAAPARSGARHARQPSRSKMACAPRWRESLKEMTTPAASATCWHKARPERAASLGKGARELSVSFRSLTEWRPASLLALRPLLQLRLLLLSADLPQIG